MDKRPAAINIIWLGMILIATVTAAYTGTMDEVTKASFDSAKAAVTLAISLIGPMALWLGLMKVAEDGGLLTIIARCLKPVMTRLFPDVPPEHPAMSAMIMNMAANALGLGNAATPMGIKAMQELDALSTRRGTATNAMCLFLAINTSSVTLLPLGVITVRAAANASHPAAILLPSILATAVSTTVAIIAAKFMEKSEPVQALSRDSRLSDKEQKSTQDDTTMEKLSSRLFSVGPAGRVFVWAAIIAFMAASLARLVQHPPESLFSLDSVNALSSWLIPVLICLFLVFGFMRGVPVYESMTEGAKEGFNTAVKIIPYMVAIFVAIGMLRASGAMDIFIRLLAPLTGLIGMPPEALAMALMRPLSGSGAFGIMSEIVSSAPDSYLSYLVSVMQGSTETTFYVLAVYFGSVGIRQTRHALPAALCADAAGILASVWISRLFY
ncbi:MAG: spore maturation protein [Thermodesulfatator sp.]|nr:MAG: spore maturation protein [Thermodesulfatator sp.]